MPANDSADHDPEEFADRVQAEVARLGPRLRDLDPDDLVLIIQSILRPLGSGRRFILRRSGDGFVL